MNDESALIVCCQGPPVCDHTFAADEDPAVHCSTCPWCKRITIDEDGREHVQEPSRQ